MENQIKNEITKILTCKEIVKKALFEYETKNPNIFKLHDLKNTETFLHNLFETELDYIYSNPKQYLEELNY